MIRVLITMLFFSSVLMGVNWEFAYAQENKTSVLPGGHVFAPLLADPHEPSTSLTTSSGFNFYDYAAGGTLDLVRWNCSDGSRWAGGALGGGYLDIYRYSTHFLDQSYSLYDIDLWMGIYASEAAGLFSNRLEFLHGTSHLGDWLFFNNSVQPITYMRDGLRFTDSFQPSDSFRLYGGVGYWLYADPSTPPLYLQLGTEIYSGYTNIDGSLFRGFFNCD